MEDGKATLIVRRSGGLTNKSSWRSLIVKVDGNDAGVIGEKIAVDAGTRNVTVKAGFFTCRPFTAEFGTGSTLALEYCSSWLALASVILGFLLFMVLCVPVALLLNQLETLKIPSPIGLYITVAILAAVGWLAFVAPLRILAAMGIHSHLIRQAELST